MQEYDSYEEVAAYLLDQFASEFGLERVEPKQPIPGKESGTTWVIDAKAVREADGATIIVECRRHTKSKAKQEHLAALAYRIIDTQAGGGIYVSPLGFQEGAEKVAAARNIVSVELSPESTNTEYVLGFLNKIFVGIQDTMTLTDQATCVIVRRNEDGGSQEEERTL